MALFVGSDIGGTFTDLVAFDTATGRYSFSKTLTTPRDLVEGVMGCLAAVVVNPASVDVHKHGTTQVINTLLERRGARTALVTTAGFRDIVEIGRASRPRAFDLDYQRAPPLVPGHLRVELRERIAADGSVIEPLREEDLEQIATKLESLEVEAVAVSLLNAYRNPVHERSAAQFLRARLPHAYVCAGTELSREWFEYERSCTAMANAYVGPRAADYLQRLAQSLDRQGFDGRLFIMSSNGGVLAPGTAREQPLALVESGPIGGCIGAAAYARALRLPRVIAFDMGGTTAKCALVEDGRFETLAVYDVGGYETGFPVRTPVVDITEVGTGGGSIAGVDSGGALRVGPRSAGSDPGPACFGRGGSEMTVTDANLLLGRISAGAFLRGALQLDAAAARRALEQGIGGPLGYAPGAAVDELASAVLALADVQMASAIKEVTVERGRDPREFHLFAFGGGGPMHALGLARELHIPRVIVPPEPGNFSALGMLFADARIEEARTVLVALDEPGARELRRQVQEASDVLASRLRGELGADGVVFECALEMRFKGQRHTVRVRASAEQDIAALREAFFEAYRRRYGFLDESAPVEVVSLRVAGIALAEKPDPARLHSAAAGGPPEPTGWRQVYFREAGTRLHTPVYDRSAMGVGSVLEGPAIVEEFGATTVLGPGDRLTVGALGELAIDVAQISTAARRETRAAERIEAQIITRMLCAIPNVIDRNIARTAYSVLVSEYKDFAVGIVDAEARLVCQSKGGLPVFVANALSAAVREGLQIYGRAGLLSGDVVITNAAATLGQHLNNVAMYTPIRISEGDDGLLGFMVLVVHWMDVGGAVPGSCTTTESTEVFQEGIQFPALKLLNRGERDPAIYRLIRVNTRFSDLVLGDMESQLAGCLMGRDMALEVVRRFGPQAVLGAIDAFWERTEAAVRSAIRAIPDGSYEASSFLDDDGVHIGEPLPIGVKVRVHGDEIIFDLDGLADQVAGPWNAGFQGGAVAAVRIACKFFFSSEDPATEGAFRPIRITCRPGTLMSAGPTAAIAGSGHNLPTVIDTILRALGQALPGRVPAAHPGTYSAQIIVDRRAGARGYHLEALAGGWGAAAHRDGNGPFRSMAHGDTPEVPVELQEATYPYRVKRVKLRTDSGGPGRHRGGLGLEKVYELLAPCGYVAMFERTRCPPWGLDGGGDGRPGRVDVVRNGRLLASVVKDDLSLEPGDEIRVYSAGGGGYGPPAQRPVEQLIDDVRNGYVSIEGAARDYGVTLDENLVPRSAPVRGKIA